MRICLFTDTLCDANGVSRFIQDMAHKAVESGQEFHVLTSTKKDYCDRIDNIHNLKPTLAFPMPFYPELNLVVPPKAKLKALAKQIDPQVIHISTPGPVGYVGLQVAKELNVPIVGTYHTNFPAYMYSNTKSRLVENITNKVMKRFYKDFAKVLTRSQEYIDILTCDIGVKACDIEPIPAGINLEFFDPKYRCESIWNSYGVKEKVKFLYVGRMTREKNVHFLLEAWKEISQEMDAALVLVGEGFLSKTKQEKTYFLGHKNKKELAPLYASSDVFVFASDTDTLGQVVMEAQSSALPAIVSTEGGPQSIVGGDPQSGLAVSTEKELWKEAIKRLYEDEALRRRYGKAGYEKMRAKGIEKSFEMFMGVHKSLLCSREQAKDQAV